MLKHFTLAAVQAVCHRQVQEAQGAGLPEGKAAGASPLTRDNAEPDTPCHTAEAVG